MTAWAAVNGKISSLEETSIPVNDRFFLFGDGVYGMLVAVDGVIIDFESHLSRLRSMAQDCLIQIPWSDAQLKFELEHLVSIANAARLSIRLIISRGNSSTPKATGQEITQRYVFCTPVDSGIDRDKEYLRLKTRKNPSARRIAAVKTNNYMDAIVATLQLTKDGFDDVLWSNDQGEITECGFANIFFICRDGDLVEIATPPLSSNILEGVTRKRIISLLEASQIPVTQRDITEDEIPRFDEAFVTSSVRGLVGVSKINEHRLYTARPSAVFHHIHRLYESWLKHNALPASHEQFKQ